MARDISFGADYLIPKPFDPRLIVRIAPAVAKAAMEGGWRRVRWRTWKRTRNSCSSSCITRRFMKPLFSAAKRIVRGGGKSRIVFTEGEDERVLRAVQVIVDEGLARPILVGRPAVLLSRIEKWPAPAPGRGRGSHQPRI